MELARYQFNHSLVDNVGELIKIVEVAILRQYGTFPGLRSAGSLLPAPNPGQGADAVEGMMTAEQVKRRHRQQPVDWPWEAGCGRQDYGHYHRRGTLNSGETETR